MVEAKLPSRWSNSERRFLKRCGDLFSRVCFRNAIADVYGDRRLLRCCGWTRTEMKFSGQKSRRVPRRGGETRTRMSYERKYQVGPDPSKWPHGDVMYQCCD